MEERETPFKLRESEILRQRHTHSEPLSISSRTTKAITNRISFAKVKRPSGGKYEKKGIMTSDVSVNKQIE